MGRRLQSSVLTAEEEAASWPPQIHRCRWMTVLLRRPAPHLTRALHGLHGWDIAIPEVEGDKPDREIQALSDRLLHVDIAEVQTDEALPVVAIDRTSKFAYAELHLKATRMVARDSDTAALCRTPYTPTDRTASSSPNAKEPKPIGKSPTVLPGQGIEHRPPRSAIRGPMARSSMNRTIKDATVKRYHYQSHDQLKHIADILDGLQLSKKNENLEGLNNIRIHM